MEEKNLVVNVAQFRITRIGGHVFAFLGGRYQECLHGFVEHADLRVNMAGHVKHMRNIGRQRGITVGEGQRIPQVFASFESMNQEMIGARMIRILRQNLS